MKFLKDQWDKLYDEHPIAVWVFVWLFNVAGTAYNFRIWITDHNNWLGLILGIIGCIESFFAGMILRLVMWRISLNKTKDK